MTINNNYNYQPVQFNLQTGGANSLLNNVVPSTTLRRPLVSNGVSTQPSFSTALVAGGGTGQRSFSVYSVICGGTTSTNPLQSVSGVGTSAQVLTSNGAGALPTWQTPSGGFLSLNVQVFTASGTYTPTTGMSYCIIECIGGGGGGGGVVSPGTSSISAGGGGGAGGYSRMTVSAATIGASQTVTIGAGGAGGTTSGTNGSAGTTSSVGSLLSASGGSFGAGFPTTGQVHVYSFGGAGGIGSSGDVNSSGQPGNAAIGTSPATARSFCVGGQGGRSQFGGAGLETGQFGHPVATSSPGNNGTNYGGGGSGASAERASAAQPGGAGSAGIVVITEFII